MASPKLEYTELTALATQGGYSQNPRLSQLSAVFLLSACWFLREKWIWQKPIAPITSAEYQSIIEMIEQAESDLMTQYAIGSIIQAVCEYTDDNLLLLDGSTVLVADYPILADCVPSSWVVGGDINLPDMTDAGLFGADSAINLGLFTGENEVQLTESELPAHTHTQNPHQHTSDTVSSIPTAAGIEPALASLVTVIPTLTGLATATNNNTGGDAPHNNIQRSLTVFYYIVAR